MLALLLALVLAACGQAPTPPAGDNDNDETPGGEVEYTLFSALGPMTVVNPDGANSTGLGMRLHFRSEEAAAEDIEYRVEILVPSGDVVRRTQPMVQREGAFVVEASSQFHSYEYTPGEYAVVVTDENGREVARNQHVLDFESGLDEISVYSSTATINEFTLNFDTVHAEQVTVLVTRNADIHDASGDQIIGGRNLTSISESSGLTFEYSRSLQLHPDDEFRLTLLAQEKLEADDPNERALDTRFLYLRSVPFEVEEKREAFVHYVQTHYPAVDELDYPEVTYDKVVGLLTFPFGVPDVDGLDTAAFDFEFTAGGNTFETTALARGETGTAFDGWAPGDRIVYAEYDLPEGEYTGDIAVKASGNTAGTPTFSVASETISVPAELTYPAEPTVTASIEGNELMVEWNSVAGANAFRVIASDVDGYTLAEELVTGVNTSLQFNTSGYDSPPFAVEVYAAPYDMFEPINAAYGMIVGGVYDL